MSKTKYKAAFQDIWLENCDFKSWLQKVDGNPHVARCKVCCKEVNIAVHGITALHIHAKGSKHQERLPKTSCMSFFRKDKKAVEEDTLGKPTSSQLTQSTIGSCANKSLVVNAEIMWALDVVMSKYSNKNELFPAMFPDSEIAKAFACGKTKCSYLVNYGIDCYLFL